MTTINGVTFNMVNLRPVAVHRNSVSEQPGSDTNFITDMGYDGLVMRLEGFEETLATYDSVISEFMKSGEQTLVYRTGWQFKVYSAQLTPELIEGIVDNYFPYDLILYTSTPYRESTTLDCRAKEITTNNEEWSAGDIPCENILDNWSVEDWSSGTSVAPDHWVNSGLGAISRSTTHKVGTYSAYLTPVNTPGHLYQSIDIDYAGKQITIGCWGKSSDASQLRPSIIDSVGSTIGTMHSGGGDWEWLTVTRTIDSGATYIRAAIYPSVNSGTKTAYVDGAVLIEGDSIPDYLADIDTDGSVDAVPDIQVTSDLPVALASEPVLEPDFETALNWTDSFLDTNSKMNNSMSPTNSYHGTNCYQLTCYPGNAVNDWQQTLQSVNFDTIGVLSFALRCHSDSTSNFKFETKIGGTVVFQTTIDDSTDDFDWILVYVDASGYSGSQDLVFKVTYLNVVAGNESITGIDYIVSREDKITDVQVYNIADSTVKCGVCNEMPTDSTYRINSDGTGTINYCDDFTTSTFGIDSVSSDAEYNPNLNQIEILDDGYIYWPIDAKGPVTGIPLLTSQINITTGIPTIQISTDASTWYDITTAIVDDVDTVYELDSSSLHLKGLTAFYWRIDCVKSGAATCSVKSFELDIEIVTIDFEHPVITAGGAASTIRCDQDVDSGLACTIALIYRDRSWPA